MGVEGRIPDFYSAMGREWGGGRNQQIVKCNSTNHTKQDYKDS